MRLHNLQCFVRLPGQYPIVSIQFDYKKPIKMNEPFVARAMETEGLREDVLQLAEQCTSLSTPIKSTLSKDKPSSIKDWILES